MKQFANVTKHKNLQSLEHYISAPTLEEKENYSASLFDYTKNSNKRQIQQEAASPIKPKKMLKPSTSTSQSEDSRQIVPYEEDPQLQMSQNVVQNSLKQAANMFQNASFTNCNITFQ